MYPIPTSKVAAAMNIAARLRMGEDRSVGVRRLAKSNLTHCEPGMMELYDTPR